MAVEVVGEEQPVTMIAREPLDERLELILGESTESVCHRERTTFDNAMRGGRELVIFGAGNFGQKALRVLQANGYRVLAFIDNNPTLQGREIGGVRVMGLMEAWKKFGDSAGIVVAIYFGEARDTMAERITPVQAAGFSRIAHFGHLAWKFPEGILPHYSLDLPSKLPAQRERIRKAFSLFTQKDSRRWFVDHVQWRFTLDFNLLPKPVGHTIYFHEGYFNPSRQEFLIDGGAFTGDTLKSFCEGFGKEGFYKVICCEPDPVNYDTLRAVAESLQSAHGIIETQDCALGDSAGKIRVESSGGPSSRVGYGETVVTCRMIDEFAELKHCPTFIKLDIEGYELAALRGARQTIRKQKPILALSAYHKQNDLWELPLEIYAMQPEYEFRLAPHVADGWDLVLYAATPKRYLC